MTWKPTDEMVKTHSRAVHDMGQFCTQPVSYAALTAVQPLIAAEARAKALEDAVEHFRTLFAKEPYDFTIDDVTTILQSLISKPPAKS